MAVVLLPSILATEAGGQGRFDVEARTVEEALRELPIADRLFDEQGSLRPLVNVYVDGVDARDRGGLAGKLEGKETIRLVAAIAGGSPVSQEPNVNVVGGDLQPCSRDPVTGFYRNGCCSTGPEDEGSHTVCAVMTEDFLAFSRLAGNDLSTPHPEWGFPGLKPGDRWCVCAARWLEAYRAGHAPEVVLGATHARALEIVSIEALTAHAAAPELA